MLLSAAKLNWMGKNVFTVFTILVFFVAGFTISSGLGGFALIGGLWLFFTRKSESPTFARLSLGGGALIALLFWTINFIALQPHSTAPYTFNVFGFEFYPSPRLLVWEASVQTFRENFFVGRGVGQHSCQIIFENTDGGYAFLTDAHNVLLSVASQTGVFGLAAIVLIIVYLLIRCFPAAANGDKRSIIQSGLWIAFVSAFVYQGLVGSFEDSRHLWVLIGLMLCAADSTHRPE